MTHDIRTPEQALEAAAQEITAGDTVTRLQAKIRALSTRIAPPSEDWRDDPATDERWIAGNEYVLDRLCKVLGVDEKTGVM